MVPPDPIELSAVYRSDSPPALPHFSLMRTLAAADRQSESPSQRISAAASLRVRKPSMASPLQSGTPQQALVPSVPITAPNRYLGRQPILDAQRRLFGYELFYRAGKVDHFSGDPDLATREVIDHWLLLIPDSTRTSSFVNCTRTALVDGLITLLPPESTVLEILPNIEPDPDVIDCCLALKKQGYRFALDGFLPQSSRAPFLRFADFIKIDFLAADFDLRLPQAPRRAASFPNRSAQNRKAHLRRRLALLSRPASREFRAPGASRHHLHHSRGVAVGR